MQPLVIKCFVDKEATKTKKKLTTFRKEMKRLYPVELLIEEIDASDFKWELRDDKYYVSDESMISLTSSLDKKNIDFVNVFVDPDNWKNGKKSLYGFMLGRIFNSFYTGTTRYRSKYEDTAEHELLHMIGRFIAFYLGIRLEDVFKVNDFDDDIVHRKESDKNYKFDDVWETIAPILSLAIKKRREDPTTVSNFPALLITLKQALGLYDSFSIKEPTGFRYFKESEIVGLNRDFVALLDEARHLAGIPFVINSGFRTPAKNKAVGGVPDSAHLTGLACDIRARNGAESYAIIKSAMEVGIKRIGINRSSQFIHLDIDYSKPNPTVYEY